MYYSLLSFFNNMSQNIDDAEEKHENITESTDNSSNWQTVNGKVSKGLVRYITQALLSVIVMLFCMYNIVNNVSNHDVWIALLSSLIGIHLPTPTLH